jgi:signal transduction histidine kinase
VYHLHKARAESAEQETRTHVLGEGIPYLCNSPHQCPTYPELARRGVDCKTVVSVPLVAEEQVFGCIEMINKRGVGADGGPAQYSDTELKFLSLLAGQIAPGIATYLFRARKEREDRLSAIGQMLSGVLHDFKTPATIISGYVQLMARTDDPELRAEYGESIKKQFDQLNQMTGEILSFARGESTILLRKVYLNRFMDDVHELLNQELKSRNIELVLDVQYRRTAKFDEGKLKRAIFNVARNAIEAMRDGGTFRVTVTANERKNQLIFRLSDTGMGIPEDIRDRLFESFVTHGKTAGTGLGLAIVKKIVEEHDGEIEFETAPDKGTTFEIRLPLDP